MTLPGLWSTTETTGQFEILRINTSDHNTTSQLRTLVKLQLVFPFFVSNSTALQCPVSILVVTNY